MTLKLCIAQLNYVVGDMAGNAQKIIQAARAAYQRGVRITPVWVTAQAALGLAGLSFPLRG